MILQNKVAARFVKLNSKKYLEFFFFLQKQNQKDIWQNNFPKIFWEFLLEETWGAATNLRESHCLRADVSHNPTSHFHRCKFTPGEIPLKLLLSIQSSSNPHQSPGPGSFQDSSLTYTGGKSCLQRVVFHQDNLLNLLTFPKETLSCCFGGRGIQTDGQSFHVWKG